MQATDLHDFLSIGEAIKKMYEKQFREEETEADCIVNKMQQQKRGEQ
jgi:hypothetical protein